MSGFLYMYFSNKFIMQYHTSDIQSVNININGNIEYIENNSSQFSFFIKV